MKIERPTELPPEIAAKLEKRKRFPRARRWLFNFAATLSLVLFVGNYWLWVRDVDGVRNSVFSHRFGEQVFKIETGFGAIRFSTYDASHMFHGGKESFVWVTERHGNINDLSADLPLPPRPFGGFYVETIPGLEIGLPFWFLQLLFAILPLWWLGRFALRWSERKEARS